MLIKKIIVVLAIIASLFVFATKAIADPQEIESFPNIKIYAFEKVLNRWGDDQWIYFTDLIKRESNWNSEAKNRESSAYGLGQFLNSTWKIVDCKKTTNSYKQIDCTIDYIEKVYGTPKKAIEFHNKNNFY